MTEPSTLDMPDEIWANENGYYCDNRNNSYIFKYTRTNQPSDESRALSHEDADFLIREANLERSARQDAEHKIGVLQAAYRTLANALEFYVRREHWMGHTSDDTMQRVLTAMKGDGNQDGWIVAEEALIASRKIFTSSALTAQKPAAAVDLSALQREIEKEHEADIITPDIARAGFYDGIEAAIDYIAAHYDLTPKV